MSVLRKDQLEAKIKEENQLIRSGVLRDENPLDDTPEFEEFLQACRRGDLKRCQELISSGVNINGKDRFDYTPLIIASLCGHYELVQLLLESGALADRGTWVGERTVYNALNDRIRNLLLSYDYSKSTDPLQPWSSHITSLLTRRDPKIWDISLIAGSEAFHLHRFLLSARTPYFRRKLAEAPETATWRLSKSIPVEAFRFVLRYLYLGELPKDVVSPNSTVSEEEAFKGIDKLCKQLEVEKLWETVLSGNDRRLARQRYQDEMARAQRQIETAFQDTVLRHKMIVETRKVGDVKWPHDNAVFADCILRADEPGGYDEDTDTTPTLNGIPVGPSENAARRQKRSVLYPAHKAFLIRSPYFETMFSGGFKESQGSKYLHIIKVDCLPEVLEIVLKFLYTEKADCPLDLALDVLYTSDMLLLEKLKAKAALAISTLGSGTNNVLTDRTRGNGGESGQEAEPINVYEVIHAAWDLQVQRLEDFAARYLAYRLEDYIDEPEFAELIQESASRIKERQETDTIELLDDIRYYLSERFRLRFEDANLESILDENGEIDTSLAERVTTKEAGVAAANGASGDNRQQNIDLTETDAHEKEEGMMTLDGQLAEDEFASDAINYQILLGKIDRMLERLRLDA
ncbi:hypothetical protein VTK73DRAFT_5357 [Phialemonium thermophilum]|uniref:BTB domain-containing protein n=1 Tax=Phialemonium thermophilum TaxID=223376 RepID=A0ABR3Y7E4_9PEZI